jgi:hypothetical protein
MATIADLARATRMVVHGGHDYMDEKAQYFCYGHPILSIEMGGRVRHFKCTSVDVMHSNKYARLQRNFYLLEDPSACQLDKTDKSIRKPNFIPAVDLNHSVYLFRDETPPLKVYPDGDLHHPVDQTHFEISNKDKIGILKTMIAMRNETSHPIRTPYVTQAACEKRDMEMNKRHHYPTHPIQIASSPQLDLNMDDLEWTLEVLRKASNILMQ